MHRSIPLSARIGFASAAALALLATGCGDGDSGSRSLALTSVPSTGDSIFLQIVPPGSNGASAGGIGGPLAEIPTIRYPDNYRDQLDLYGDLAYAEEGLQAESCAPPPSIGEHRKRSDQACNYFKNAGFAPKTVTSTRELRAPNGKSVKIERDGWGVPYITGADRSSAEYGMGFAAAEDRLWLFDLLRQVGRGRVSEFLGPSATTYDLDVQFGSAAGYSEQEMTDMVEATLAKFDAGALADMVFEDVEMFVAGMNAYVAFLLTPEGLAKIPPEYFSLGLQVPPRFPPAPFTVNDIVANAVLIQAQFGRGGGGEATNLDLLQKLAPAFGGGATSIPEAACALWRDLRHASDPDAPYTIDVEFRTQSPPRVDESCPQALPAGAAIWDAGSLAGRPFLQHGSASGLPLPLLRPLQANVPRWPSLRASADSGRALSAALGRIGLPKTASNWIGVNAGETKAGHPIIVAGPQTGYFVPQLLWEASVVSTGGTRFEIAAHGITTVNLPYIVIGHGLDFGWSATSAGSDLIDTRVSRICNLDGSAPSLEDADGDGFLDADGYVFDGACVRFYRRLDQWTATPTPASIALGGPTAPEEVRRYVLRTHYGPVTATATVGGGPVVISEQRSTFFADLDTAAPFALLTTSGLEMSHGEFKKLFNSTTSTFNWIYADAKDLGFFQSGLYPVRHPAQHPELPVWGDGRFEWGADQRLPADFFTRYGGDGNAGAKTFPSRAVPATHGDPLEGYYEWPGYLPMASHIQVTNPPRGYLANWNNAGAPGWWAADANGTFGPTHRVRLLSERLAAFKASGRKHDVGTMIESMGDAAFTDLRGQDVLPLLLEIMRAGGLTADQQTVVGMMQRWIDAGSNQWISGRRGLGSLRRDRDADGRYDFRAEVVLMDAWYPHLIDTLLPQLTALEGNGASVLQSRYDAPRAQGSAYQEGWYEHMKRVLEMALGTEGRASYRVLRCADGTPAGCRGGVLAALDRALADLGGLANVEAWNGAQLDNAKGAAGA
ncbi:MAG: penicillin acylase family protein, partial [Candidatus Binatia bacterium]